MQGIYFGICAILFAFDREVLGVTPDRIPELQFPKYDGRTRVLNLNSVKLFDKVVKRHEIVAVLFTLPKTDDPVSQKTWTINDYMLEMTAQVMQNRDIAIGYVDILANADIATKEGITRDGAVHVYRGGRKLIFYGHRSPEVLLAFLMKLFGKPVTILESKTQKKSFDNAEPPKVIGYFQETNKGYKAFEEAAKNFQPNIPFYAVFDKKVAKPLKLKNVGTIHFYKPYETHVKTVPNNPASSTEIIDYIEANRRPILRKLSLDDVHSTWMHHPHAHLIIAFVRPHTEDGMAFFTLLKKLARANGENENISIVWIDPGPFPSMLEYWERTYGIDVHQSSIGLVNITDNKSSWFDVAQLESLPEGGRLRVLQQWLSKVEDGSITVEPKYETQEHKSPSEHKVNQTNVSKIADENLNMQTKVESGVRDEL